MLRDVYKRLKCFHWSFWRLRRRNLKQKEARGETDEDLKHDSYDHNSRCLT